MKEVVGSYFPVKRSGGDDLSEGKTQQYSVVPVFTSINILKYYYGLFRERRNPGYRSCCQQNWAEQMASHRSPLSLDPLHCSPLLLVFLEIFQEEEAKR